MSRSSYKNLLKNHLRVEKAKPQILREDDETNITQNIKIKISENKIKKYESRLENKSLTKQDKISIQITLKKESAKLKALQGA